MRVLSNVLVLCDGVMVILVLVCDFLLVVKLTRDLSCLALG